jgi:RND family efflux transporter MFP subunit
MSAQSTKSRLLPKVILVLVVLAAAGAGAHYVLRPTARVVVVERGHADDARPGSVTVAAQAEVDLKSEVSGRLLKSDLDEGKHFKEGEFMAQLDTGDIDITIERAENDQATHLARIAVGSPTEFTLKNAESDVANHERLLKMGQYAEADLEREHRGIDAIKQQLALEKVNDDAQRKADAVAIKEDKRQLEKMTLRAPFDGIVSTVVERPGALIAGGAPVAHFTTSACTIQARISEENFGGIVVGDKATVIFLSSGSSHVYNGTVSKLLPTLETLTQRYVVYLDVQIPDNQLQLKPGMTGEVTILVATEPMALLVPRRSIGGNKVLVVNNGHVEVRSVKLGYVGLNRVQILDGVKEGDLVITDDLTDYSPGDTVRTETIPMPN